MPTFNFEVSIDLVYITVLMFGGFLLLYKKVFIPFLKLMREVFATKKKIDQIYIELNPNGGSSIKDAINRIELKLIGVEQKQNVYLLESPQGIFEADVDGRIIRVNRTYLRLTERTESEILGNGWKNIIAGSDRERVVESWDKAMEDQSEFICKYNIKTPKGDIVHVQSIVYPIVHPINQKIIGWLGTVNKAVEFDEYADSWR